LHLSGGNCPYYGKLKDETEKSKGFLDQVAPYETKLYPRLETLTGMTVDKLSIAQEICSYIFFADLHNKKLKFVYTQDDLTECQNFMNIKVYYEVTGDDRLWQLKAFYFL